MNEQRYRELKDSDFKHIWHPFTQHKQWFEEDPLIIEQAAGAELIDVYGKRYLDGVSSLWCNVHGHGAEPLKEALHAQVERLCHSTLLGLSHVPVIELSRKLSEVLPGGLSRIFFSDSGSAAVEAALRMAVESWQRRGGRGKNKTKLISLSCGYHGDTLGAVGLGFIEAFHRGISPHVLPSTKFDPPHIYRWERGCLPEEACEKSLAQLGSILQKSGDETAALFMEPVVQGAAGIWVQPVEFGAEVRHLCRRHDVLLIADEVATGFGKTGRMFAVEHGALDPDLLIMGKGLSGGYLPLSAVAVRDDVFLQFLGEPEELRTFFFGQTFSGNPLACAAACANLDLFRSSGIMDILPGRIAHFRRELDARIGPLSRVAEVRSFGFMTGIELTKTPGRWTPYELKERAGLRVAAKARELGAVIRPLGNVMVLMPPLIMSEEQLSRLVEITAASISAALGD